MPWKETCPMDQRVAFIADWLRDEWTMTRARRAVQISRKTGYKWVDRYEADPDARAWPSDHARRTRTGGRWRTEMREAVLALRRAHPHWGPKKLRAILTARHAARGVAGGQHDGRFVAARGSESAAAAARAMSCRLTQPLAAAHGTQRGVDGRFQGLVSDGGWDAVRSADGRRCVQSVRVVLSHCGAERARSAAVVRADVSGRMGCRGRCARDNGSPFATTGRRPALAFGGVVVETGDSARSDRSRASGAERAARAVSSDVAARDGHAARARRRGSSSGGLIGCAANSIPSGRMKRLGQQPPGARLCRRHPAPTRRGSRTRGMTPTHQVRRVKDDRPDPVAGRLIFVSEAVRGELVGLAETERGDWTRAVHARGTRPHRSPDATVYAGVARPADRLMRSNRRAAAMEMPRLWKSQNDFHSRLEISPSTRDSHIPTADPLLLQREEESR